MQDWITVISFTYPHEAHMAMAKLESEGIDVQITNELTTQVHNFYSNAIGGVEIQVKVQDAETAEAILIKSGYIKKEANTDNKTISSLDRFTSKLPLIGNTVFEFRVIMLIAIILIIIAIPVTISLIPSKTEMLTKNSWCVDKIIHNGKEIAPHTTGITFVSSYDNCIEMITLQKDGIIIFPGINSNKHVCNWILNNDSIHVTDNKNRSEKSLFSRSYKVDMNSRSIQLVSDSITIVGYANIKGFSF